MHNLIIDNHIISNDIMSILNQAKAESGKLKIIDPKLNGDEIRVTCPVHKGGQENRPSCGIYVGDDEKLPWGTCNCFTCHFSGSLGKFIGACFDSDERVGNKWLKDFFTDKIFNENIKIDKDIVIDSKSENKRQILSEEALEQYQSWHPYLAQRKLSKEVCRKFKVKYDTKTQCIVFPVWDAYDNLRFVTRRNVNTKEFYIPEDVEKPVYLLNNIIKNHIKEVYVCESQINALTLEGWGYNAIALFGTGSEEQYKILNKSGIYFYHICFDGDEAGTAGAKRFIRNVNGIIDKVDIPPNMDVNDLSKEEFQQLLNKS